MEDHQIVSLIRESKNSKAFQQLYHHFPMIRKMVLSRGGKKEDAEDIFQEALIILCRKVRDQNFVLSSKLSTFLYSICNLLWKDEIRKRQKTSFVEVDDDLDHTEEANILDALMKENDLKLAEDIISGLGERCQELLLLFYNGTLKLKEIAEKMGYSSEGTAKNQKYKCLEAAKNKLREFKEKEFAERY